MADEEEIENKTITLPDAYKEYSELKANFKQKEKPTEEDRLEYLDKKAELLHSIYELNKKDRSTWLLGSKSRNADTTGIMGEISLKFFNVRKPVLFAALIAGIVLLSTLSMSAAPFIALATFAGACILGGALQPLTKYLNFRSAKSNAIKYRTKLLEKQIKQEKSKKIDGSDQTKMQNAQIELEQSIKDVKEAQQQNLKDVTDPQKIKEINKVAEKAIKSLKNELYNRLTKEPRDNLRKIAKQYKLPISEVKQKANEALEASFSKAKSAFNDKKDDAIKIIKAIKGQGR